MSQSSIYNLENLKVVPSVVFACTALFSFYFFYFSESLILLVFLFLVSILIFLISFCLFRKRGISLDFFVFLLCASLGLFASTFSYISFLDSNMPLITLAQEKEINMITVCLQSDAKPNGEHYYLIKGEIFSCKCKDSSTYSCEGNINILIPANFIRQNYINGVISNENAEEITLFCKGIIMEVTGHFSRNNKKETLQYVPSMFIVENNSLCRFLRFSSVIYAYRTHLRFFINRLLYGWEDGGNLLFALLTANKDFLRKEDICAFREAGLSHVLALSGMHLAIVGSLATFLSSLFFRKRVLKFFVITATLLFFIFAGASPSLFRSFLMLCIVLISCEFSPKTNLLGILSFTLFIHLLIFPQDSLSLSFVLSYGAVFGILVFGDSIYYFFSPYVPDVLNESISASLGASFFTFPIISLTIGKVSLIGVVASILISPMISIFLSFGVIAIFLNLIIPQLYHIFGIILNFLYKMIINIVYVFANFPVFCFEGNAFSYFFSFLPFAIGIFIAIFRKRDVISRMRNLKL